MNTVGQFKKFKARLVEKVYSQVEGVDFSEIFSLVEKLNFIRILMSLDVEFDLEIEHVDVKKTFLYGDLEEEMYMKKHERFVVEGKKDVVCKLKIFLYGLKESPNMWYQNC
jgi:hypothetical protein